MASDWTAGYVADVAYTYGFYREMTPAHLRFALLLKGIRPPAGPFNFCELGFGQGYGLNLLAASNPEGEFWGTDFNPAHAAGARLLADAAGTDNLHVFDRSFAEFLAADLPDFDFICVHGVWSWITPENQDLIVEFLRRRLKPGGVVYISYNALPGWAAIRPLRELLSGHAALSGDPLPARVERALGFAERLQALQIGFFPANPPALTRYQSLLQANRNYIAHEFFTSVSHPTYFSEIARALAVADLGFAGSSRLIELISDLNLPPDALALLEEIDDPIYRELVRDFLVNQTFRCDLFVRDAPMLDAVGQRAQLMAMRAFLLTPRETVALRHRFRVGERELRADVYEPVLDQLSGGPRTVAELLSDSRLAGLGLPHVLQAITLLTGLGYTGVATGLDPAVGEARRRRRAAGFNNAVLDRSRLDEDMCWLASPLMAGGVLTSTMERLFLLALQRGDDPPGLAHRALWAMGKRLVRADGSGFESEPKMLEEMRRHWQNALQKQVPVWRHLGVV